MESMEIFSKVMQALRQIAPECEEVNIDRNINLQEQLDLDSVDMLHYMECLQKEFHIKIPDQEYGTFLSINGATEYLSTHQN